MSRREQVLAMLAKYSAARYALTTERQGAWMSIGMAIRNVATLELRVPAASYDAFRLLALVEKHGGVQ